MDASDELTRLPNSGQHAEYKTGAIRDSKIGNGLPSLMPLEALRVAAKRFEDGAIHYGTNNWQKGIPLSRYVDSLYRHLWQWMEDEKDEDHGGAIIWNVMCMIQTKKWIDEGKLPNELNDL